MTSTTFVCSRLSPRAFFIIVITSTFLHLPLSRAVRTNMASESDYVLYVGEENELKDQPRTYTNHQIFPLSKRRKRVRVETSPNVFVENLQATKNLETSHYVMSLWMTDFVWHRTSGLKINIGLDIVSMLPVFESHLGLGQDGDGDNLFAMSDPNAAGNKKHYEALVERFCRQPVPNFYILTMEIAKDRLTEAWKIGKNNNNNKEEEEEHDDDESIQDGGKDDDEDEDEEDERNSIIRSINRPCVVAGSYPEPMLAAQNSVVCTSEDSKHGLGKLFGVGDDSVHMVTTASRSCKDATVICKKCLEAVASAPCMGRDASCCQIDCLSSVECTTSSSSRCRHSQVICAMGTTYRFTLQPIFLDPSSSFSCLLRNTRPELLFKIWFYVQVSGLGFETQRRWITVKRRPNQLLPKLFNVLFLQVEQDSGGLDEADELVITGRKVITSPSSSSSSSSSSHSTRSSSASSSSSAAAAAAAPLPPSSSSSFPFPSVTSRPSAYNFDFKKYEGRVADPNANKSTPGKQTSNSKSWTFWWKRTSGGMKSQTASRSRGHSMTDDRFRPTAFADNAFLLMTSFDRPFAYSTSRWSTSAGSADDGARQPLRSDCYKDPKRFVPMKLSQLDSRWSGGEVASATSAASASRATFNYLTPLSTLEGIQSDRLGSIEDEKPGPLGYPRFNPTQLQHEDSITTFNHSNHRRIERKTLSIGKIDLIDRLFQDVKFESARVGGKNVGVEDDDDDEGWVDGKEEEDEKEEEQEEEEEEEELKATISEKGNILEYTLKSARNSPSFKFFIPGNTSVLRWWSLGKGNRLLESSLNFDFRLTSDRRSCDIDIKGRLLECPGFVSIVINDWTEDEEILRYDLLVACPPEFNFTLTFPCQPLGSSSGPAHLLDRHRSNRRQRKEKLLQTSLKRYHPLQGQKPTYDPMSPKHPLRSQAEWFDHRPETQSQEAEEEYQLEFHLAFEVLLDDGEEIYRKIMTSLAYKTSDNRTTNERKFGGGALHLPGGEPDAIFQFGDDGTLNIYRESRLVIFILGFTIVMFFLSSTRDYYHELRRYNNCDRIIFRFSDPSPCRCVDLLPGLLRRFCPQDLGNTKRLESPSKMNIQIPGDDYRKTDDQADLTTPTMLTDKLNPPRLEIKAHAVTKIILPVLYLTTVIISCLLFNVRSPVRPSLPCHRHLERSPEASPEKLHGFIVRDSDGDKMDIVSSRNRYRWQAEENLLHPSARPFNLSQSVEDTSTTSGTGRSFKSDRPIVDGTSNPEAMTDLLSDSVSELFALFRTASDHRNPLQSASSTCPHVSFSAADLHRFLRPYTVRLQNFLDQINRSASFRKGPNRLYELGRKSSSAINKFLVGLEKSKSFLYLNSLFDEAVNKLEMRNTSPQENRRIVADMLGLTDEIPKEGILPINSKKKLNLLSAETFIRQIQNRLFQALELLGPSRNGSISNHRQTAPVKTEEVEVKFVSARFHSSNKNIYYQEEEDEEIKVFDYFPPQLGKFSSDPGGNFNEQEYVLNKCVFVLLLLVDSVGLLCRLNRTSFKLKIILGLLRRKKNAPFFDETQTQFLKTLSSCDNYSFQGLYAEANLYSQPSQLGSKSDETETQLRSSSNNSPVPNQSRSPTVLTFARSAPPSTFTQLRHCHTTLSAAPLDLSFSDFAHSTLAHSPEIVSRETRGRASLLSAEQSALGDSNHLEKWRKTKVGVSNKSESGCAKTDSFGRRGTFGSRPCINSRNNGSSSREFTNVDLLCKAAIYSMIACVFIYQIATKSDSTGDSLAFDDLNWLYEPERTDKTLLEAILEMAVDSQMKTFKLESDLGKVLCLEKEQRFEECDHFDKKLYGDIVSDISVLVIHSGERRTLLKNSSALNRLEKIRQYVKLEAVFLELSSLVCPQIYAITIIFVIQCCLEIIDGTCCNMATRICLGRRTDISKKSKSRQFDHFSKSAAESNRTNLSSSFSPCGCASRNFLGRTVPEHLIPIDILPFPSSFTETNV